MKLLLQTPIETLVIEKSFIMDVKIDVEVFEEDRSLLQFHWESFHLSSNECEWSGPHNCWGLRPILVRKLQHSRTSSQWQVSFAWSVLHQHAIECTETCNNQDIQPPWSWLLLFRLVVEKDCYRVLSSWWTPMWIHWGSQYNSIWSQCPQELQA